jgi:DHA1 family bicyclomycin/chloramphenicol resistance-like MFS transporter
MLQAPATDTAPAKADLAFGEFVALIASMMALTALSIDIMLPALAHIGEALQLPADNDRQLVITFYLLGFAAGQPFFGPLSDRFGRKKPLYAGLLLFVLASVIAATATSATTMFAARALQGFGAAAPRIIGIAIVRDRFAGRGMARVMSFVMMVFIVIPIIAPSIGQGLIQFAAWRWIFAALVAACFATLVWVWLRLPETHSDDSRVPLTLGRFWTAIRTIVTTRQTFGYALSFGFIFGLLMAYIGSAEQIFLDVYGLGEAFPLVFGAIASVMILASITNARLVERVGMRRVSHLALLALVGVCGLMALGGYPEKPPLLIFGLFMAAVFFCFGLMAPNFNAMAMEPVGHIAGTASSFVGFYTTTVGAFFGFLIGQSFDGSVRPLAIGFTLLAVATLITVLIVERGRLAQPQQAPPRDR